MRRIHRLHMALGLLWIVDALLQLQPANLGAAFSRAIASNAMGQPVWLQTALVHTASLLGEHPALASLTIAGVQILLGAAILIPATRRSGLACSVVWALGVWVLGEGLGGVATGFAMLPSGAPGPALLYALAALVLLPSAAPKRRPKRPIDERLVLTERAAALTWSLLWVGAALLQAVPVNSPGFKLSANLQMTSLGEPASLAGLDHVTGHYVAAHGAEVTGVLVAVEMLVGFGALAGGRLRSCALVVGCAVCAAAWVVGENLGGLLSGAATDVGAMPLYVLIGCALWSASSSSLACAALEPATSIMRIRSSRAERASLLQARPSTVPAASYLDDPTAWLGERRSFNAPQ